MEVDQMILDFLEQGPKTKKQILDFMQMNGVKKEKVMSTLSTLREANKVRRYYETGAIHYALVSEQKEPEFKEPEVVSEEVQEVQKKEEKPTISVNKLSTAKYILAFVVAVLVLLLVMLFVK